jgi:hypothetical protein
MIAKGTEHKIERNNKENSQNPLFILYVVVVILILPQAKSPSSGLFY